MSEQEIIQNALEQQEAWQRRIENQREIINRYDGYRRWTLAELLPAMQQWALELNNFGQATASAEIEAMAQRMESLAENPPEEWA